MVTQERELQASEANYCIISGDEPGFREFQCGSSRQPNWLFQHLGPGGAGYRYVTVLSLKAGEEWQGAFR